MNFDEWKAKADRQCDEIKKYNSLTYLEAVRICQAEIGYHSVHSLVRDSLEEEISEHPDTKAGNQLWDKDRMLSKMHFEDAEMIVCGEFAYRIYLAVKDVLERSKKGTLG